MRLAAANAPLFIEAFHDGCKSLKDENEDLAVPDIGIINRLLAKHEVAYEIRSAFNYSPKQPAGLTHRALVGHTLFCENAAPD
jgi:hypothetical protein